MSSSNGRASRTCSSPASARPDPVTEVRLFTEAVRDSDLSGAALFADQSPGSWDAALCLLAAALPADAPSVVVIDEMPYVVAGDAGFEGTLQKLFDRELSRRPVLLLCIGSDLAMMEALNDYSRPFHQRATELVVPPLSPGDVADMLALGAADAFDAFLVTGGLPLVLDEWEPGASVRDFLGAAVPDPTSALLVSAERALAAEFPTEAHARQVLVALGSGERSYALIGRTAGGMSQSSLSWALVLLVSSGWSRPPSPCRPSRRGRRGTW